MLSGLEKLLLGALGFFLPPVPVFLLQKTVFTKEFLVTVILTCLGHVPGVIFSFYFIFVEYPRKSYTRLDDESHPQGNRRHRARNHGHHHDDSHDSHNGGNSRYTDTPTESSEAPVNPPVEVNAPVAQGEGSSDAAPPTYDEAVPQDQQLKQSEVDSKRDNKIQH